MIDRIGDFKIALAHDWLVGLRGGEMVLDRLARLTGPTKLYTLVKDGRPLTEAIDACCVVTSPLQRLPGASGGARRWYLPLMPWAVERLRVGPCDLLVSTSSAVMKSIQPPPGVPHLCYCHSPARYLWEQTEHYAAGRGGGMRSIGLRMFGSRLREWDRRTASRVTQFLANSAHTAARIKRCFDREAKVVHPPVRTQFFAPDPAVARGEDLLVVAAHEPYKRTDLAIEAANRGKLPLVVVGGGSQWEALKRLAGPTVRMAGRVTDQELRDLYRKSRAMVQVQMEDFGIAAAEAQACGCPVIAYRGGGAGEIVTDRSGVLIDEQSVDAVLAGINELQRRHIDARACVENAQRFSEAAFDSAMIREMSDLLESRWRH